MQDKIVKLIKNKYSNVEDLKENFTFLLCFAPPISEDFKKEITTADKDLIEKIEKFYQNGDEIWHYSDFGFAPIMSSREVLLLKRDGKTIKEFMIRMS